MNFEIKHLISKIYTTEKLCEEWFPLILRNNHSNLPDSSNLPIDLKDYDIVYAIQEEGADNSYGFFVWNDEIGGDGITHRYTLEKVILDTCFDVCLIGNFFQHIISSLTCDYKNEYRIRIDGLDKPYKHYLDNTNTIDELSLYLKMRLEAEKNGALGELFLKRIDKTNAPE